MRIAILWVGLIASFALSSCAEREVGAAKLTNYVERLSTAADIDISIFRGGHDSWRRVDLPASLDTASLAATGSLSLIDFCP